MKKFTAMLLTLVLLCTSVFSLSSSAIVFEGELGDVNNDGGIDAADALLALQHSVTLTTLKRDTFERSEVSGDDIIDAADALLILQHSVALLSVFPRNLEEENDLETSHAYEPDPTADTSFSINYDNLADHTIYLTRTSTFRHSNNNIKSDNYRFACSFQGLLNRDFNGDDKTAMMFLYENNDEKTWLEYIQSDGKFLNGYEQVELKTFDDFLTTFDAQIRDCGIVLWDTQVPSTANVAATICGVDGYLPVKYDTQEDSLYNTLIKHFGEEIVKFSLVDAFREPALGEEKTFEGFTYVSSGSSKCDAYLWALESYMDRCSAKYIAYTIDGEGTVDGTDTNTYFNPDYTYNCIVNHDYYIARRCFFFDLTSNATEAPCDDPNQPLGTDQDTMKKIMQARYDRANGEFGQLFGFPPWWLKYTSDVTPPRGNYGGVQLEWDFTEWCSAYNLAKEADAQGPCYMYNASVYYKYIPAVESYENNQPAEKLTFDPNTYYFTFYLGDYDSSAWMKRWVTEYWMEDNKRGEFPMAWAFNPNLSDRAPMLFDYVYENKTDNDYFIAGDSGAGYVVPSMLLESSEKRSNPDGTRAWLKYATPYYQKIDLDITGFILNTSHEVTSEIKTVYNQLSPVGSFYGTNISDGPLVIYNGIPYLYLHTGISALPADRENTIQAMFSHMFSNMALSGCNFSVYRNICHSPDDLYDTMTEYIQYCADQGLNVQYVDPYTLFDLIHQSGQGKIVND